MDKMNFGFHGLKTIFEYLHIFLAITFSYVVLIIVACIILRIVFHYKLHNPIHAGKNKK